VYHPVTKYFKVSFFALLTTAVIDIIIIHNSGLWYFIHQKILLMLFEIVILNFYDVDPRTARKDLVWEDQIFVSINSTAKE